MKPSTSVIWLSFLVAAMALIAAAAGLFWTDGGSSFTFTSLRGQTVEMYGQGLYRNDSLFTVGTFLGTDVVTLAVCIPLLLISIFHYRRGSLRGGFLLLGALSFFLYNSASLAFGAAYNALFPLYIAWFSASLFAFILAMLSFDFQALAGHIAQGMPRRGIATFMFIVGITLFLVWLSDLGAAIVQNKTPVNLGSYTTMVTFVLDLGILAPMAVLAGWLVRQHKPQGYLLASVMLTLNAIVGLMVIAQSVAQWLIGIRLSTGQIAVFAGSFVALSVAAVWLNAALLGNIVKAPLSVKNVSEGRSFL